MPKVATVLGSIPASSDTMESERRQMKQCWIKYIKRKSFKCSLMKTESALKIDLIFLRKQKPPLIAIPVNLPINAKAVTEVSDEETLKKVHLENFFGNRKD
jgi:hypothetical protein